ncbi:MAG TPA: MFS transporter [Verrucomicrobiota bacterium]|nr:MFS transporter [Verrucomicrobiota bacterium]
MNPPAASANPEPTVIPHELAPLYWFAALNALSFQPVLMGPMILFAKSLGASATVLGILAGMMPLLVMAQLPAAQFVNRVGYRRFVLSGWSIRVGIIFLIALVPVTGGFLDPATRLVLLVSLLLAFNISRGISSAAWLPWITELVPASLRGRHFARDQFCMNGASMVALAVSGLVLGIDGGPWRFAAVFLFSAITGVISLYYLKRIPDAAPPPEPGGGIGPVPWRELAGHVPFRKLLEVNIAWSIAYGGLTTFVVMFLRNGAGFAEDRILYLMSVSFIGGVASPWLAGPRLARLGSKPMLGFTMGLGLIIGIGWWLAAGRVLPATNWLTVPMLLLLGLVNALFSAANNRLAMEIVPPIARNHFFALFMVVWQLTLGLSPVLWGLLLDVVGPRTATLLGFEWNRYSLYFGLVAVAFIAAFAVCRRLVEPRAAEVSKLVRELMFEEPRRWWTFFVGR